MANKKFSARYGPWVLIAGASEGLGAAFAREAAAEGCNVILLARRAQKLQQLAIEIEQERGVEAKILVYDLGESIDLEPIKKEIGNLDIGLLVYNAAYPAIGIFADTDIDDHKTVANVNVNSPLALTYYFANRMKSRGSGGIILMSSLAAFQGSAMIAHYAATKAYNLVLAEGLWAELREQNVDVLACCAGATATPNYEASAPQATGWLAPRVMQPHEVVKEAFGQLGKRGSVVVGKGNRLAHFFMTGFYQKESYRNYGAEYYKNICPLPRPIVGIVPIVRC